LWKGTHEERETDNLGEKFATSRRRERKKRIGRTSPAIKIAEKMRHKKDARSCRRLSRMGMQAATRCPSLTPNIGVAWHGLFARKKQTGLVGWDGRKIMGPIRTREKKLARPLGASPSCVGFCFATIGFRALTSSS